LVASIRFGVDAATSAAACVPWGWYRLWPTSWSSNPLPWWLSTLLRPLKREPLLPSVVVGATDDGLRFRHGSTLMTSSAGMLLRFFFFVAVLPEESVSTE
jgi:hypothetical protein